MDYFFLDLSWKFVQNFDDFCCFILDDLEKYMQVIGDMKLVLYLVEKYLVVENFVDLECWIVELQVKLKVSQVVQK